MGSRQDWGEAKPPRSLKALRQLVACDLKVEVLFALAKLNQGPVGVTALAEAIDRDITQLSPHLHAMHDMGLVRYESRGTRHLYALTDRVVVTHVMIGSRPGVHLSISSDDGSRIALEDVANDSIAGTVSGMDPVPAPPRRAS